MLMDLTWQYSAEIFFHVRYNKIYVNYIIDQVSLASRCILRKMSCHGVLKKCDEDEVNTSSLGNI